MEKELTRADKYKIIKKFSKLNLSMICKKAGISRQAIYLECLSDKKLDAIINIINEEIVNIWQK